MPLNFAVVDVETANHDLSSICQVGIASFRDGALYESWESLVNPEDRFDRICVSIHGIDEGRVRGAPTWSAVYSDVIQRLAGKIVASHTTFDRVALLRACEKHKLATCECRWLDSAMVVRRAWPTFARSGYSLANVAATFGIKYQAHDALEDARCAGEILLRASAETGLSIDQWFDRVGQPIRPHERAPASASVQPGERSAGPASPPLPISRHGNPDGPLFGEVLVFTGGLSMPRHEAADAAAAAGCEVATNVSRRTTLLVVGDQDVRMLAGQAKSTKHRKAEELIDQGEKIRIISESDFQRITEQQTLSA